MKTAITTALGKVLRGGRSWASLLQASGRRMPPLEDAAVLLLPSPGLARVPPAVAAAAAKAGSGPSSQLLPLAVGRGVPKEGGLLPRLGATLPPPAAAGVGSGASSQSPLQAVGRRLPQKRGLACSLLPRLGATVPPSATTWRFHQMAGLCSSADAVEQLACEEHMACVQNLDSKIKGMEDSLEHMENMWWVIIGLGMCMAVTLPEPAVRLWVENTELASEIRARKESSKELDEEISCLQRTLQGSKRSEAAATGTMPTPVPPAAPSPPSAEADA